MYDLHDSDPVYDQDDPRSSGPQAEDMAGSQEPPEDDEDEEREPLDMEQILDAIDCIEDRWVVGFLKEALAERRSLREQLAYWRALPLREEFAITDGTNPEQASVVWPGSAEDALRLAEDPDRKPWVRSVTVHPWQDMAARDVEVPA